MNELKLQKSIRQKTDEYLLGIVCQFQQSDEIQSVFNCYDYIKIIANLTKEDFMKTLTVAENKVFKSNQSFWLSPIESLQTFTIFLTNNEINLNQ